MPVTAKLDEKAKTLIITVPLMPTPELSKSGKTYVIASTQGNKKTGIKIQGKEVTVGAFAYIPADK